MTLSIMTLIVLTLSINATWENTFCVIMLSDVVLNVVILSVLALLVLLLIPSLVWEEILLLSRKSNWRGKRSTFDLLVLTSLDQLVLIMRILLNFLYKTGYVNEEVICTEPSPSVSIPCFYSWKMIIFSRQFLILFSNSTKRKWRGKFYIFCSNLEVASTPGPML